MDEQDNRPGRITFRIPAEDITPAMLTAQYRLSPENAQRVTQLVALLFTEPEDKREQDALSNQIAELRNQLREEGLHVESQITLLHGKESHDIPYIGAYWEIPKHLFVPGVRLEKVIFLGID
jgi:hypothetical protein